jgi:nucleoid DNA-binding protein
MQRHPRVRQANPLPVGNVKRIHHTLHAKGDRKRMNKTELINEMAKNLSSKKEAESALDGLLAIITQSLKKGDKLTLSGFGTFKVSKRKARTGRNPRTGEKIKIKARKVPQFSPGKALKTAVE